MSSDHSPNSFEAWEGEFARTPQGLMADLQDAYGLFDAEVHERVNGARPHDPLEMISLYHDNLGGEQIPRTVFEHRQTNWFQIRSDVWGSLITDARDARLPSPKTTEKMIVIAGIYRAATELLQQGRARVEITFN